MNESIGRDFMRKTRPQFLGPSAQSQGVPQPPLEQGYPPETAFIALPDPKTLVVESVDLRALIEKRRSTRRYSMQALSLTELSYLLWCTQGVKSLLDSPATLRTVPSAGARHAFETYLLANRVDGLQPGLYHYSALKHALVEYNLEGTIAADLSKACMEQRKIAESAVTFIWAAVVERMAWRYGERGYRYLHLDAGHVCQNLYLAGEALGCGTCAIAAYNDDAVNALLGLDGDEQFVIYLASLGKHIA